jgi:hypothetical protein
MVRQDWLVTREKEEELNALGKLITEHVCGEAVKAGLKVYPGKGMMEQHERITLVTTLDPDTFLEGEGITLEELKAMDQNARFQYVMNRVHKFYKAETSVEIMAHTPAERDAVHVREIERLAKDIAYFWRGLPKAATLFGLPAWFNYITVQALTVMETYWAEHPEYDPYTIDLIEEGDTDGKE